jgi:hypothetical protein
MASSISAGTTSSTALVATADTSGSLVLQTNNGTTALTLSAAQIATFANPVNGGMTVQVFTSGSGTYTRPTNCKEILIRMIGGGGGGGGSGSVGETSGGTGGNTTFGGIMTASGGVGGNDGTQGGNGPNGGAASVTTSATVIQVLALTGGSGQGNGQFTYAAGPMGASSPFGGGGGGGSIVVGRAATPYGAGGAGGGGSAGFGSGSSGAAGGYVEAIITSPSATYSYAVGSAGTAGSAGTSGYAGGAGGSGVIIVMEYYV